MQAKRCGQVYDIVREATNIILDDISKIKGEVLRERSPYVRTKL